ncbi:MAG: hypothetical protein LBH77_07430, partial [Tannerella sp.]|nr:hypothetical protein [Tannerella sp.]
AHTKTRINKGDKPLGTYFPIVIFSGLNREKTTFFFTKTYSNNCRRREFSPPAGWTMPYRYGRGSVATL